MVSFLSEARFKGAFEGFTEFKVVGDRNVLDIALGGVIFYEFLVIVFGGVEGFQGFYFGDDLAGPFVGCGECGDLIVDDLLFFGGIIENDVAVLGADIVALAVELGGVDAGEESFDEGLEGDLRWVVKDLYGFGVTGGSGTDFFIAGVFGGAAGEAGDGVADAHEALEDDLRMPEAAFGEIGGLFIWRGRAGVFCGDGGLGLGAGDKKKDRGDGGKDLFHFKIA